MRNRWISQTGATLLCLTILMAVLPAASQETGTLSLSQAVSTAIQNNRELEAVRRDKNAADLQKRETESGYYPQLSYAFQLTKTHSDKFDFDLPAGTASPIDFSKLGFTGANWSNKLQLTQLIYDHTLLGTIALASLQKEAAQWQKDGQEQIVVFDSVSAYLDILRAQELLNVQQQRLLLANKQLQTATANYEAGLRIRTDVLRAELTRSSALRDVVSSEIALERAQVVLNQVIGVPMEKRHQFDGAGLASYTPHENIVEAVKTFDRLFAMAQEKNPSIQLASILVKQREQSVSIARGEFLPTASFGGSWGYNDTGDMTLEDQEWAIQVGVQVPLFEGGRKMTKIRRTKEQLEAQKQRCDAAVRAVHSLVEQSALALQEERRNLEIALEAAIVAKENHERFLNLYEEGLADSLDVTQALTEKVTADTNVVTTRYGFLKVYAQLLYALGTIPTQDAAYEGSDWLDMIK
ncbi:MAG: TolC family protein [Candidatus Omnitrophota bacterium]